VPQNAAAGEAKIKLYPAADGHVGQIQVFDRQGDRLGALTRGSSAFEFRRGAGGRFAAVRFAISPAGGGARPWRDAAAVRLAQYRPANDDPAAPVARPEFLAAK
jgi:hypothetical protein